MQSLFRRVLVPYDFSPHATRALAVALELARKERGRVTVLHVVPVLSRVVGVPPGIFPPAVLSAALPEAQRRRLAARVARALRGRKAPRVGCRVVVAEPLAAILDAAAGATAIVMGTLGLTGLPHLVIGSVAEKVVRHAPIPVLTIRAGGRRGLRGLRARAGSRTRPPRGDRRRSPG
jgi:nucleotide-binding universal stress UspA family protein